MRRSGLQASSYLEGLGSKALSSTRSKEEDEEEDEAGRNNWRSQEDPRGAGRSDEEPGGARRSQEEPHTTAAASIRMPQLYSQLYTHTPKDPKRPQKGRHRSFCV